MARPKAPEAVYRICDRCGNGSFNLVGYQNRTLLQCTNPVCDAAPFPTSQKGHLNRAEMPADELRDFIGRLESAREAL